MKRTNDFETHTKHATFVKIYSRINENLVDLVGITWSMFSQLSLRFDWQSVWFSNFITKKEKKPVTLTGELRAITKIVIWEEVADLGWGTELGRSAGAEESQNMQVDV